MRAPKVTFDRARKLRRDMTLPEVLLWQCLPRQQLDGLRFRRQHPVGPYILDFYCAEAHLAIEVDGSSHDFADRAAHDGRRSEWLARHSIRVLRFPAADVLADDGLSAVLDTIRAALDEPPPSPSAPPPPLRG